MSLSLCELKHLTIFGFSWTFLEEVVAAYLVSSHVLQMPIGYVFRYIVWVFGFM